VFRRSKDRLELSGSGDLRGLGDRDGSLTGFRRSNNGVEL
jgi:hypothetical protein